MKNLIYSITFILFSIFNATAQTPSAYWPFDETSGTIAEDVAGNNDGTLINGPSWITGIQNGALQFDGTNDRVDCGSGSSLNLGTNDFTIATWINMKATQTTYPTFVAKGGGASYDAGYWFFYKNKRLKFYLSNGTTRIQAQSVLVYPVASNWHHIAVVAERDGNATFYFDGDLAGTFDISAFNGEDIQSTKTLTLGAWQTNTSTVLNGSLDETRIYNMTLTDAEIALLADSPPVPRAHWPMNEGSGTITEDVEGDNNGTLKGGTLWTTGVDGGALQFDGVDDRVNCGSYEALRMRKRNFTISTWVKMEAGQVTYPTFVAKGGGASYDAGYWFHFNNNRLKFFISNGTTRVPAQSGVVSILDNEWHHIAVVADRDGDAIFYLDGQNVGNYDISSLNGFDIISTKDLTLGSWVTSATSFLNGCMDDTRIYDAALDATQIIELYDLYSEKKGIAPLISNNNESVDAELLAYPNPSKGLVHVKFKLDKDSYTTVRLYDNTGREVARLFEENASMNDSYVIEFNAYDLTNGMYVVQLQTANGVKQVTKVILQK